VTFFHNAADAAKSLGGTVLGAFHTLSDAWNGIPQGVRDLIVKGVVADRTIKFLFGFSPIGAALSGIESAIAKGLGNAVGTGLAHAGLGKLFVQPVFVRNMVPGGRGGAAGGGARAWGGARGGGG